MSREEIIKTINGFLVEEFEVDESAIEPSGNLKDTLELDSLDFVDLVVIIESHFGFKVVAEDFVQIKTFNDFYEYIIQEVEKQA